MRTSLQSGTAVEIASGDNPTRGVVVVPDIMGLRPLFDDMVERLAVKYDWKVAAVEPFPGRESMTLEERMIAMAALDDDRQVADIVAASYMVDIEPVAVLGFCMGGMYTMKAAATGRFDRAAPFYGMIRVPEAWRGPVRWECAVRVPRQATQAGGPLRDYARRKVRDGPVAGKRRR